MMGNFLAKRWLVFCVFSPYALSLFLGHGLHSLLPKPVRSCNHVTGGVTGRMSACRHSHGVACRNVCRGGGSRTSRTLPNDRPPGEANGLVCTAVHARGDGGVECPVCQLLSCLYCGPSLCSRPNGHDLITHLPVEIEQQNDHDYLDFPTNRGPPSENPTLIA